MSAVAEKFNALEGDVDYITPTTWDLGHVAYRMTRAFMVLRSLPGGIGPHVGQNGWPAMLQEIASDGDAEPEDRPRYTAIDHALMDEALQWPMRFLMDVPIKADAILLWAYAKATDRSIKGLLRGRVKLALARAERMTWAENARREMARSRLARETAETANLLLQGLDPEHPAYREQVNEIREQARQYFGQEINAKPEIYLPVKPFRPSDADPLHILSRTSLDRHLSAALELLSSRLHAAGVPVR
jgi:hypothetical protein